MGDMDLTMFMQICIAAPLLFIGASIIADLFGVESED